MEYQGQLEVEQKQDLRKRMEDATKSIESDIVAAYSMLVKFSARSGANILQIRNFKDSIDQQINTNLLETLKEEEWLLDSIGLSTLKNNNLLPTIEHGIRVKDVYEAFLRFDDKPMITGPEAVSRSIQRYCTNGEFCIATGDGTNFTRYYYQEPVSFFDINDSTYWLIEKSLKPAPQQASTSSPGSTTSQPGTIPPTQPGTNPGETSGSGGSENPSAKQFKSITISGHVPLERYTELFNYFITPFGLSGNKIEIQIAFKILASEGSPLDDAKQQYKSAKEAAKQLGLKFDEEGK
jgi:hypothetical protein